MEPNVNPNRIVKLLTLKQLVADEFRIDEFDKLSLDEWIDYYYGTMSIEAVSF